MLILKNNQGSIGSGTSQQQNRPAPPAYPWEPSGAADIEDLLAWAYRDQQARRYAGAYGLFAIEARAAGYTVGEHSADGCAAVERIGSLGAAIDISTADPGRLHPVAELIDLLLSPTVSEARASLEASGVPAALLAGAGEATVLACARSGQRPAWDAADGCFTPALGWTMKGGERLAVTDWTGTRPSYLCCPVLATDAPAVRAVRWLLWWRALVQLRRYLEPLALGFALTGPSAPEMPWLA